MRKTTSQADQTPEASAFLKKTYAILMDKRNKDIIEWSSTGETFAIVDPERFASEVLPYHFKHNKTKSFIRQLNIHGFKKAGSKKGKDRDYFNEHFKRGRPDLLANIQRISVKHQKEDAHSVDHSELDTLRSENQSLKKKIVELESNAHLCAEAVDLPIANDENRKLLEMIHVIAKIKNLKNKNVSLSDKELQIFTKAQTLLDSITELQESESLESDDSEHWKDASSLGKRSTLSIEKDAMMSPSLQAVESLPWLSSEFKEDQSFVSREFDFCFND